MTDTIIEVRDLSRHFRRADGQAVTALDRVTFSIRRGQFVCLLGPSGCGKSTLLQIICGLLHQSSGGIEVDGRPVTGPGPDRGVVFQKDSVFPWMRVIDNVEYGLKCRGLPRHRHAEEDGQGNAMPAQHLDRRRHAVCSTGCAVA